MGGQIALRGFERQEMLTAAVKLFAQLTGLPTTPSTPQTQQVSLGSVVSGTVKYDVSHMMTDGKMSFSMNNVTLGQQILPYIQSYIGIPSIVYMLGVYTVRFGQQGPLNDPVIQAQQYLGGGPTPRPTSKPIAPTRAPTFPTPTRIPTFAPSLRPTRVPTAMPTFSKLFLLTGKLQRYLASNLTQNASLASADAIKVLYNEVIVAGQPTALGGCNNWRVSTGSALTTTLITQIATSVTLYAYNDANNAEVSTTCADATSANAIVTAVAKAGAFLANVTCGTHTWRVDRCLNTRTAVCVDCANPCVGAVAPVNGTCNNQYTLNPCGTNGAQYGCAAALPSLDVYRVLSATFRLNPAFIPPVVSAVAVASFDKTTATVTVTMSTDGIAYCGQFAAGTTPTSAAQITGQNFLAASSSSVATVKVTGLSPSTAYTLYCLSQSSLGTLASLATAVKYRVAATTACCKTVTITLNVASLYQNSAAASAVSVDLDALPSKALTINLAAAGAALVPANITVTSTSALATAFASIGAGSTGTVGTLAVTATLTGASAAEYAVVFASGASSINVITLVTPLPPPTLSSVQFSSDGTALVATMSANSDQAQISAARWPCYQLFRFAEGSGLNGTKCAWTSLSSVQMTLDSNAAVLVSDSVTLKGGRIRAACSVANTTKCQSWATTARTTTTVLAPAAPVVPKVRSHFLRASTC